MIVTDPCADILSECLGTVLSESIEAAAPAEVSRCSANTVVRRATHISSMFHYNCYTLVLNWVTLEINTLCSNVSTYSDNMLAVLVYVNVTKAHYVFSVSFLSVLILAPGAAAVHIWSL